MYFFGAVSEAPEGVKMQNILLGKVIKAMYKLSGKTITQLADETGLTVDTLNNLFYARLIKPGFFGVENVVEATGYTVEDLISFMKIAEKLPEDADMTEEFSKYIFTARETKPAVNSAVKCAKSTEACESHSCCREIKELYQEQIKQMEQSSLRMREHFDRSVAEIRKSHQNEIDGYKAEIRRAQNVNRWLTVALIVVAVIAGVIAFILKR